MRALQIFYPDPATNYLRVGFANGIPSTAYEQDNLVTKIAKLILNRLDSNKFSPDVGSPFATISGKIHNYSDDEIHSFVILAISDVENYILKEQATSDIPMSNVETLVKLELYSLVVDPDDPTNLRIKILVYTAANTIGFVNL